MNFETALSTMKKYGGRIRRSKYPNFELTLFNGILFTLVYDGDDKPTLETEINVSTKDIMAEDWEVNLIGSFVNEDN